MYYILKSKNVRGEVIVLEKYTRKENAKEGWKHYIDMFHHYAQAAKKSNDQNLYDVNVAMFNNLVIEEIAND